MDVPLSHGHHSFLNKLNEKLGTVYFPTRIASPNNVTNLFEAYKGKILHHIVNNDPDIGWAHLLTYVWDTGVEAYQIAYRASLETHMYNRYYSQGAWTDWAEYATKPYVEKKLRWVSIEGYDLIPGQKIEDISYKDKGDISELLFSYGTKNKTQAYGGGTIIVPVTESKPAALPVYSPSGNTGHVVGYIYIYNEAATKKITLHSLNNTDAGVVMRVLIYYR